MAEEDYTTSRMVTLTDGVLSIAMTLLVLDVHLPGEAGSLSDGELWRQLLEIWPQILSYFISFVVIALLWLSHVQKFRHIKRMSSLMVWLNIMFLLGVGIVPFTTALLAENGNAVATAVYAAGMAFASLMLALMSVDVNRARLVEAGRFTHPLQAVSFLQFATALLFAASAGVAFLNASDAKLLWLLLIPLGFVRDRRFAEFHSRLDANRNGQGPTS